MNSLKQARQEAALSQRALAKTAGIAYKSLQLIEKGHDTRLSTIEKIGQALQYPKFTQIVHNFFLLPPDSVRYVSLQIASGKDWQIPLFNLVDSLRRDKNRKLIDPTPVINLDKKYRALLAAVIESLCEELNIHTPWWTRAVEPLLCPWFISNIENLKASALIEAPIHFRKRNIFVLNNFLDRA